jgi:long-chain acyl-CoA synthetase
MTEAVPATILEPRFHTPGGAKLGSAGRATYFAEVKIVDPSDREVPRGEVGEILIGGPMVMKGYWNQPKLTEDALRGGWMHTGDAGYMDEDGFLFVVDRLKDMIISGGENVYSAETENAIYQHPAVAMCAVIGIPHEEWGEQVHAIVLLKDGQCVTEEELVAHCRKLIAGYKCPRSVEITKDPLPVSGVGKILKRQLRERYKAEPMRRARSS